MQLRFSEDDIQHWAGRYRVPKEEDELMSLRDAVQARGYLLKSELRQLARWKSPRSAPRIERNADGFIQEVTSFAFGAADEKCRIAALTLLEGVAWPTASVVLHLFHRNDYPILDFRALWSLQVNVPQLYQYDFWHPYLLHCKSLANRAGVSMRVLDRALWQHSKEQQPAA